MPNPVVTVLVVMVLFGSLGALCSRIWSDGEPGAKPLTRWDFLPIIVPGVTASFVVPLFLSIGGSNIFKQALEGATDFWYNAFIIAGFSTLAGVSAPSFVNALARRALDVAENAQAQTAKNKEKTQELESQVDNIIEVTEQEKTEPFESSQLSLAEAQYFINECVRDKNLTETSYKVLYSLMGSKFKRRTVNGISSSTGLSIKEVYKSLSELIKCDFVKQVPSKNYENVTLYQANVDCRNKRKDPVDGNSMQDKLAGA